MKLLADSMLGSLGKWLRLLGYDTAIARRETDAELVHLARAEGRVLLTRDRELARRQGLQIVLIGDDQLAAQLAQVARSLPLPPPEPGTRCAHCNAPLVLASAGEVAGDVPAYVLQTQSVFRRCPTCGRVYWRGTHWRAIEQRRCLFE
jgi:hypothetical protein